MNCALCETRKPKRSCPAVGRDICTICCATGREETIDCPIDCEFLLDAHAFESVHMDKMAAAPNQDIEVTEEFMEENQLLTAFLAVAMFEGASKNPASTDWDLRDALAALVRTSLTEQSGLHYETTPDNLYAAAIVDNVREKVAEARAAQLEESGTVGVLDANILKVLAFFQRIEYVHNNGRKRSRAFLHFLGSFYLIADDLAAEDALYDDDLDDSDTEDDDSEGSLIIRP